MSTRPRPTAPEHTLAASAAPPDPKRWLSLAVLAAGLSMIVLDGTIVGVVLPTIIADLSLNLTDAQWITSLYAMVFAALLLTFGRVADRIGRRTVFIVGILVFVAASVTAGMAGDGTMLIASRAVQGIGGAMILPTTLSTMNATFTGQDRARAFGVWGAVMAGMAAIGPLLGGWLTTVLDWRWIFYVNVPLGALVLLGAVFFVPQTKGAPALRGVDVDGLLTSGGGMALVVFGLIEGTSLGWLRPKADFTLFGRTWPATAPISIALVALIVGIVLLGLFIVWEGHRARVRRDALLDLTLFRIPTFSWGNITATTVAAGEFALVFLLPLYLVNVLGMTVMGTGLVLSGMALGAFVSGAMARRLAAMMSSPSVVLLGLGLELVGILATVFLLRPDVSPVVVALALAVYGVGLGLASAQLTSTVLVDVPTDQSGAASATQSTVRQVGSALGTAVAGTALAISLAKILPDKLAAITGLPAAVAEQLNSGTIDSAGGMISSLREQGVSGRLGQLGPQVTDALAAGFATATQFAMLVAAAFVTVGLLGAFQVRRVSNGTADDHAENPNG